MCNRSRKGYCFKEGVLITVMLQTYSNRSLAFELPPFIQMYIVISWSPCLKFKYNFSINYENYLLKSMRKKICIDSYFFLKIICSAKKKKKHYLGKIKVTVAWLNILSLGNVPFDFIYIWVSQLIFMFLATYWSIFVCCCLWINWGNKAHWKYRYVYIFLPHISLHPSLSSFSPFSSSLNNDFLDMGKYS